MMVKPGGFLPSDPGQPGIDRGRLLQPFFERGGVVNAHLLPHPERLLGPAPLRLLLPFPWRDEHERRLLSVQAEGSFVRLAKSSSAFFWGFFSTPISQPLVPAGTKSSASPASTMPSQPGAGLVRARETRSADILAGRPDKATDELREGRPCVQGVGPAFEVQRRDPAYDPAPAPAVAGKGPEAFGYRLLVFQDIGRNPAGLGRGQLEEAYPTRRSRSPASGPWRRTPGAAGSGRRHESPFEPADIAWVEAVAATELAQREAKGLSVGPEKCAEIFAGGHPIHSFCCIHYTTTERVVNRCCSRYNALTIYRGK